MEKYKEIFIGDLIVVILDEERKELKVSLHWLEKAGFTGKVTVCEGHFGSKPVFEWTAPQPAQTAIDLVERVLWLEEGNDPDLDVDASLQGIINALVAAHAALKAKEVT